jgi:hypothetical protein
MTQHRCEKCGAENVFDAEFCTKCDFYLGWDVGATTLDDTPLTTAIPTPPEPHPPTEKLSAAPPGASGPIPRQRAAPPPPASSLPRIRQVVAPELRLDAPQVTLDPAAGGAFDITVRNKSTVADGYTVTALNAPQWLLLEHPRMLLPPGEEQPFTIRLTVPPHLIRTVHVQRLRVRLQICSVESPAKRSDAELVIVIPRFGPPSTMSAEPNFIRLHDGTSGRFRLRLDNRAGNYPQRFGLSGTDSEGLVQFTFRPQIVDVPPTGIQSIDVHFETPAPRPGALVMRTLTVTAANKAARVEAVVTVEHRTTQAPPDPRVTLQLDPIVTRKTDQTDAEVIVLVDNRRGSRDRHLHFSGRDPVSQLRFGFDQQQVLVRAGDQARVRVRISAPLPRPGEQIERPFTVACTDGVAESQATGTFGILASAPSDATTRFHSGAPQHPAIASAPTHVPVEVTPPGDGSAAAEPALTADDVGTVEAGRLLTHSLRIPLTLLGGLLVIVGAIRPWFSGGPTYAVNGLLQLPQVIALTPLDGAEKIAKLEQITQPGGRAIVLILAAIMLLGILPASGRYTVIAGILAAVSITGYIGFAMSALDVTGPAYGAILVALGGVIGAVGGLRPKRRGAT